MRVVPMPSCPAHVRAVHGASLALTQSCPARSPYIAVRHRPPLPPQDVQLQDAGAWATLTQEPDGAGGAEGAAAGGEGGGEEDAGVDDDLWNEFQGRATQERDAEELKAALEEEQRR